MSNYLICVALLCCYGHLNYAMHSERGVSVVRQMQPHERAYLCLRGCHECNIPKPPCPILVVRDKYGSLYHNICGYLAREESQICQAMFLKEHKGLSSPNDYRVLGIQEDQFEAYTQSSHSTLLSKRCIVERVLFLGSMFNVDSVIENSAIQKRMQTFFTAVYKRHFDITHILAERWGEKAVGQMAKKIPFFMSCLSPDEKLAIDIGALQKKHCVFFNDDNAVIVTQELHNRLFLWNEASCSNHEMFLLHGHQDSIQKYALSGDGSTIVSVSGKELFQEYIIWCAKTGEEKSTILTKIHEIIDLAVSNNGQYIAIIYSGLDGKSKKCSIWDVVQTESKGCIDLPHDIRKLKSLFFTADNEFLMMDRLIDQSGDRSGVIIVELDRHQGKPVLVHKYAALEVSNDGAMIALADYDHIVKILHTIKTKKPLRKSSFNGLVTAMSFHANSRLLLLASMRKSGTLFSLWDIVVNEKRDIFFACSVPHYLSPYFASVQFNKDNHVILASNNSFILGRIEDYKKSRTKKKKLVAKKNHLVIEQ